MTNSPRTDESAQGRADLRAYWEVLADRRWVVAIICGAVTLVAAIRTFTREPVYEAHTLLEVQRLAPDVTAFRDMMRSDNAWQGYSAFYETQYQILSSRTIARSAAVALDLPHHPLAASPAPGAASRAWRALRALLPSRAASIQGAPADPIEPWIGFVQDGLEIFPVKDSNLIRVGFRSPQPRLAAQAADAVSEAYIDFVVRSQFDTTNRASDFLAGRTQELRGEVEMLETKLQAYREQRAMLPDPEGGNIEVQSVADMQKMAVSAQARRAQAEAELAAARQTPPAALPEVTGNPAIQQIQTELDDMEIRRTELLKTFKPEWPEVAVLTQRIEGASRRLLEQQRAIAASVVEAKEARFRTAQEEERRLGVLLGSQKNAAQRATRDALGFSTLQAEIARKRSVLDSLVQRQNEIAVSSEGRQADIGTARIVDRAIVPLAPVSPRPALEIPLGFMIGLLMGVAAAFAIEAWDNTLHTTEDIARLLELPTLVRIPRAGEDAGDAPAGPAPAGAFADLVSHHAPASRTAEAFRDLRTALALSAAGTAPRVVAITSTRPEEGKSTVALNLAAVRAQGGRKILLVDADLRRPRLHRALGVRTSPGLSTLLCGKAEAAEAIVSTAVPGLDLLPSGPVPPNPAELLDSSSFDAVLNALRADDRYDGVILDAPPILTVTDAVLISARVDGTLLVVESDATTRDDARRAVEKLRQSGARLLGAVLNKAESRAADRYGYTHYSSARTAAGGAPAEPGGWRGSLSRAGKRLRAARGR